MHNKITVLIKYLKEKENLTSTANKDSLDKVHKTLVEKGEERKKIKEDKLAVLKEQAEEERDGRKRMIEVTSDMKDYLKECRALDQELLGCMKELIAIKRQRL